MGLRTNKPLRFQTQGGLPVEVEVGAPVREEHPLGVPILYVDPAYFAPWSIERHDATYYGFRVRGDDVRAEWNGHDPTRCDACQRSLRGSDR
jgi:hypothetical protein